MATKASHKACQTYQISDVEPRTPVAEDDFRIRCDDIRPLRWDRANRFALDLQQEPGAVAVVSLPHANQRLAAKGVKRMRDPYKMSCNGRNVCILS